MSSLDQRATVASNTNFRNRVMMAALQVATEVFAEDPTLYEHVSRLNFARSVVSNPTEQQVKLGAVVATNDAIVTAETATAGSSADTDIVAQIRTSWNLLAGVPAS